MPDPSLLEHWPAAVVSGIAGTLLSVPLVAYASRRSAAQPVPVDLAAEAVAVVGALDHPDWLPAARDVEPQAFTDARLRAAWTQLVEHLPSSASGSAADADESPEQVRSELERAGVEFAADAPTWRGWRHAVRSVQAAAGERADQGRVPLAESGDGRWFRPLVAASRAQRVGAAMSLAAGGVLAPLVVGDGASGVFGAWALLGVSALGTVTSVVDVDTLYVDRDRLLAGLAGVWALAAVSCGLGGHWGRLGTAAVVALAVALFLEGSNGLFRLVRGVDGFGFGDVLVVLGTVGVPVTVTGSVAVGLFGLMASFVLGAVTGVVQAFRGRRPFPFVPFLSAGWLLALVGVAVTGQLHASLLDVVTRLDGVSV